MESNKQESNNKIKGLPSTPPYQMEINISNVNAKGQIVLNDQRLIDLIHWYPFLYNPRVRPHNDPDYVEWAWDQIANFFNESYKGLALKSPYTASQLQARWELLKPIASSLSKARDVIPETLRQTIIKITIPMESNVPNIHVRTVTQSEKVILDQKEMVESLSSEDRRRLEAEIMQLLLNEELESRGTIKLGPSELELIEKEYFEFMKTIRIKDLQQNCFNQADTVPLELEHYETQNDIHSNGNNTLNINDNDYALLGNDEGDDDDTDNSHDFDIETLLALHLIEGVEVRTDVKPLVNGNYGLNTSNGSESPTSQHIENTNEEEPASNSPTDGKEIIIAKAKITQNYVRQVPIADAHKYIKKCRIKIKSINMADYVPLVKITNTKRKRSK